jgi:aspartate/methionine/tyrosine aminotransferase
MTDLVGGAGPELQARWRDLQLGYTDSDGLPELRVEIAGMYENVDAGEVLVAAPEELIFLAMNALLSEGDHVVCTFPGYQSLYEVARAIGGEVSLWEPAEEPDRWHFDPNELERLLRPATKLVVWNFPHNPTGALPTADDHARMLDIVAEAGVWVFSDEMYRLLEPPGTAPLVAAVDRYHRSVSLSGMSKSFSLAGLRIGWVATHDVELLRHMKRLKDYTTICSSAPSEVLALMGLRSREAILAKNRERVCRNIELATDCFRRHQGLLSWVPPQGGTVCFPRLTEAGGPPPAPAPPPGGGAAGGAGRGGRHTPAGNEGMGV